MRGTVPAAFAVLALALAGCSDDSDAPGSDDETSAAPGSEDAGTEESDPAEPEAAGGDPSDPCSLVTEADIEAAYGVAVPLDGPSSGQHTDGDLAYTSANCNWESETLEVSLEVSGPSDFPDGGLMCPPLSYLGEEATPVDGVGAPATFVGGEDPDEIEARLRVCADEVTFDIEVDAELKASDVDTLRDQGVVLAEVVLANLS